LVYIEEANSCQQPFSTFFRNFLKTEKAFKTQKRNVSHNLEFKSTIIFRDASCFFKNFGAAEVSSYRRSRFRMQELFVQNISAKRPVFAYLRGKGLNYL